jgi:hypothetical protein
MHAPFARAPNFQVNELLAEVRLAPIKAAALNAALEQLRGHLARMKPREVRAEGGGRAEPTASTTLPRRARLIEPLDASGADADAAIPRPPPPRPPAHQVPGALLPGFMRDLGLVPEEVRRASVACLGGGCTASCSA